MAGITAHQNFGRGPRHRRIPALPSPCEPMRVEGRQRGARAEPKPSQLLDVEASLLDGAHRVGRGVTATGEPGPDRGVGDLLHRAQASGVGNGVLEEPEDPTRPQNPSDLGQRGRSLSQ